MKHGWTNIPCKYHCWKQFDNNAIWHFSQLGLNVQTQFQQHNELVVFWYGLHFLKYLLKPLHAFTRICVIWALRSEHEVPSCPSVCTCSANLRRYFDYILSWCSHSDPIYYSYIVYNFRVEIPVPVSKLPRESHLYLTLYAVDPSSGETKSNLILSLFTISELRFLYL